MRTIDVTKKPFLADRTGRRDSTRAIQKAADLCLGRDVLYFPAGIYKCKSVTFNNGMPNIKGDGPDKTIIQ